MTRRLNGTFAPGTSGNPGGRPVAKPITDALLLDLNRECQDARGKPLAAEVLDLPDGARVHWEREIGFACLTAYGPARKRRAIVALAQLGIFQPDSSKP